MKRDECENCGKPSRVLTSIHTMKATYSSPAEGVWICDDCLPTAEDMAYEDEMRSLRGLTDDERERI